MIVYYKDIYNTCNYFVNILYKLSSIPLNFVPTCEHGETPEIP